MSVARGPGLSLIPPPAFEPDAFAETLAAALDAAEIACLRLALDAPEAAIRRAADALRPICAARDVALTVAEDARLCVEHGLDGVHLGAGAPASIRAARQTVGRDRSVGAWGGASKHWGMTAAEAGADYVALGPVRSDGSGAPADLFAWWAEMIETPVVAEGGLTPDAAREIAPFVDFVSPRMSVWAATDGPATAVRAYTAALAG